MQKITMQDLAQIHCLSQVACSPDGSSVAFVVTRASLEKNAYLANLWLWENGSCRKLTSGDKIPTASPQRQPRRHPPSNTGRYMGSHFAPPSAPETRCINCGNSAARSTMPAEISAFTVIRAAGLTFFLLNTRSIIKFLLAVLDFVIFFVCAFAFMYPFFIASEVLTPSPYAFIFCGTRSERQPEKRTLTE